VDTGETDFDTPSVNESPRVSVGVEGGLFPPAVRLPRETGGMTLLGGSARVRTQLIVSGLMEVVLALLPVKYPRIMYWLLVYVPVAVSEVAP
jgi:hypothetical protein